MPLLNSSKRRRKSVPGLMAQPGIEPLTYFDFPDDTPTQPQVSTADENRWFQPSSGKWVAFGELATTHPQRDTGICPIVSGEIECFDDSPKGPRYWRLPCTPKICGTWDCETLGHGKVLFNFRPPLWKDGGTKFLTYDREAPGQGNPFHHQFTGHWERGFYMIEQSEDKTIQRLVWNERMWGPGPPPNWGESIRKTAADTTTGGAAAATVGQTAADTVGQTGADATMGGT